MNSYIGSLAQDSQYTVIYSSIKLQAHYVAVIYSYRQYIVLYALGTLRNSDPQLQEGGG